ncbi:hypothetical protein L0Y49_00760 [bacterium]|nr:hypothetical protein [bacterium]MCI0565808.1 hypothetical protein [bacterium]MCI0679857.1 hypothetical protein [bacterium]
MKQTNEIFTLVSILVLTFVSLEFGPHAAFVAAFFIAGMWILSLLFLKSMIGSALMFLCMFGIFSGLVFLPEESPVSLPRYIACATVGGGDSEDIHECAGK